VDSAQLRLVGMEGLALLRAGATGNANESQARLAEIEELIGRMRNGADGSWEASPVWVDAADGYDEWAESYDDDVVAGDTESVDALEEGCVRKILDSLEVGHVLDAGCGSGRHAAYLVARGHTVCGIDVSKVMIDKAELRAPSAEFRVGTLERLPYDDDAFDAVVCALALSHLERPENAIAEIARVLAPGGRLVVSNPHPFATAVLGLQTVYIRPGGELGCIREFTHGHGVFVNAFAANGLRITGCTEPSLYPEAAALMAPPRYRDSYRAALDGMPLFVVWEAIAR